MPLFQHSFLEIFRFDAFVALAVSLVSSIFLVLTKTWHGALSLDTSSGPQKVHTQPTPRIGGIGIALGVLAGYAAASPEMAATEKRFILGSIILAGIPAFVFGLLEDLTKRVSVRTRLLATMSSGVIGWGITGTSITHIGLFPVDWLLSFTAISVIFTAFAVGGVANSINIIDGFNGLTAGALLIMLAAFGMIARHAGDIPLAFTCLVIAGAVFGFFLINWPFGKIFLGDGGAYFLGFAIAWIAVLLPERNPNISPWTSLLVCSYPVLEVIFSILRRSKRDGYHPGQPDGVHLHQLANRRWARKLFPKRSRTLQNGFTSPVLWAYTCVPCLLAYFTIGSINLTLCSLAATVVIYVALYRRLAFFRWLR